MVRGKRFYNTSHPCWEQHCCNRTWVLKLEVRDKAGSVSHLATRTSCVTCYQKDGSQAAFGRLIIATDWRQVSIRCLLPNTYTTFESVTVSVRTYKHEKLLHAGFPFWVGRIVWFYVEEITYYVNFHPSTLLAKWFAFQWQIPIEPQLRHLDIKLEISNRGKKHFSFLHLTFSQGHCLGSLDGCTCKGRSPFDF